MTYGIRSYGPVLITRDSDTSVVMSLTDYGTGQYVDLSAGVTWELKAPGGEVKASGSASIGGGNYEATATVAASNFAGLTYSDGWRFEWSTAYGLFSQRAALVRADLHCSVTAQDLLDEDPELNHVTWKNPSGNVIPWEAFILAAYKQFYGRLVTTRAWPWRVVNPDGFRSYILFAALGKVYRSLMTDANERYAQKAEAAEKAAETEWGRIELLIDPAEEGAGSIAVPAEPVVYLSGTRGGAFTRWR